MAPSSKKQLASLRQNFEKLKDRLIDTKPLFEEIQLFRQLIATAGSLQQLQSAADAVAKRKGGRLSCAAAAAPAGSSGTGAACAIVVSTPQAGTEAQPAADAGEKAAAKLKVQQERDEAVAALKKKETENASLKTRLVDMEKAVRRERASADEHKRAFERLRLEQDAATANEMAARAAKEQAAADAAKAKELGEAVEKERAAVAAEREAVATQAAEAEAAFTAKVEARVKEQMQESDAKLAAVEARAAEAETVRQEAQTQLEAMRRELCDCRDKLVRAEQKAAVDAATAAELSDAVETAVARANKAEREAAKAVARANEAAAATAAVANCTPAGDGAVAAVSDAAAAHAPASAATPAPADVSAAPTAATALPTHQLAADDAISFRSLPQQDSVSSESDAQLRSALDRAERAEARVVELTAAAESARHEFEKALSEARAVSRVDSNTPQTVPTPQPQTQQREPPPTSLPASPSTLPSARRATVPSAAADSHTRTTQTSPSPVRAPNGPQKRKRSDAPSPAQERRSPASFAPHSGTHDTGQMRASARAHGNGLASAPRACGACSLRAPAGSACSGGDERGASASSVCDAPKPSAELLLHLLEHNVCNWGYSECLLADTPLWPNGSKMGGAQRDGERGWDGTAERLDGQRGSGRGEEHAAGCLGGDDGFCGGGSTLGDSQTMGGGFEKGAFAGFCIRPPAAAVDAADALLQGSAVNQDDDLEARLLRTIAERLVTCIQCDETSRGALQRLLFLAHVFARCARARAEPARVRVLVFECARWCSSAKRSTVLPPLLAALACAWAEPLKLQSDEMSDATAPKGNRRVPPFASSRVSPFGDSRRQVARLSLQQPLLAMLAWVSRPACAGGASQAARRGQADVRRGVGGRGGGGGGGGGVQRGGHGRGDAGGGDICAGGSGGGGVEGDNGMGRFQSSADSLSAGHRLLHSHGGDGWLAIATACSAPSQSSSTAIENILLQQSLSLLGQGGGDGAGLCAESCCALELLAALHGWAWAVRDLVQQRLEPLLYSPTSSSDTRISVVRLLSRLRFLAPDESVGECPDEIVQIFEQIVADESFEPAEQLAAAQALADVGNIDSDNVATP